MSEETLGEDIACALSMETENWGHRIHYTLQKDKNL